MESEHNRLVACLDGAKDVRRDAWQYVQGRLGSNEAVLARCGIGKVNAAVGTAELLRQFAPDCVVSTGVAGGIDASLRVMDVVAGASVVYHDVWCGEGNAYGQVQGLPAVFSAHPVLLSHALAMDKVGGESRVYGGLICTGDRFITDRPSLDAIKARFPQGLGVICMACLSSVFASSATHPAWTTTGSSTRTSGARWPTALSGLPGISWLRCLT